MHNPNYCGLQIHSHRCIKLTEDTAAPVVYYSANGYILKQDDSFTFMDEAGAMHICYISDSVFTHPVAARKRANAYVPSYLLFENSE